MALKVAVLFSPLRHAMKASCLRSGESVWVPLGICSDDSEMLILDRELNGFVVGACAGHTRIITLSLLAKSKCLWPGSKPKIGMGEDVKLTSV
jgi:hypothetical protein